MPHEPSCVESSSRTAEAAAAQLHPEVWIGADCRCGAMAGGWHIWGISVHIWGSRCTSGGSRCTSGRSRCPPRRCRLRHDPPAAAAAGPGQGAETAARPRSGHGLRERQGEQGSPADRPAISHPKVLPQLRQPCPVTSRHWGLQDAVTRDGIGYRNELSLSSR